MTSPLSIGTTSIIVAPINRKRAILRMQNTGGKDIYVKKIPLSGLIVPVSATDYDVVVAATTGNSEAVVFETNSINAFQAISSTPVKYLHVFCNSWANLICLPKNAGISSYESDKHADPDFKFTENSVIES